MRPPSAVSVTPRTLPEFREIVACAPCQSSHLKRPMSVTVLALLSRSAAGLQWSSRHRSNSSLLMRTGIPACGVPENRAFQPQTLRDDVTTKVTTTLENIPKGSQKISFKRNFNLLVRLAP
jgi:hypothetical protein